VTLPPAPPSNYAVAALRADLATITEALDPGLRSHVAELDARVERHCLLLGPLLDQAGEKRLILHPRLVVAPKYRWRQMAAVEGS
jgi:hypothetical protein